MALDGMYVANISGFIITAMRRKLGPFLGIFATNISDQIIEGDTVDMPVVAAEGEAVDLTTVGDDRSHADVSPEFATTKKQLVLNHKPARGFFITPWEAAKAREGILTKSLERKIDGIVNAVAKSIINNVLNLVTAANFANSVTINPAAFDQGDVSKLRTLCDALQFDDEAGTLLINSLLHESLREDGGIVNKSASGADTLNTGILPRLHGFDIMKSTRIPVAGGTPADENLIGFAALPQAIAVGMRPLLATEAYASLGLDQHGLGLAAEEALADEDSSVCGTLTIWANSSTKTVYHCFESWFGSSIMDGNALLRLKT